MYQESDYIQVKTMMTRFIVGYAIAGVLVLAGIIYCLAVRSQMPLYPLAGVFTIASVFFWGMTGSRVISYGHFLKDMREGRESAAQGVLADMDELNTSKDGVEFRALRLLVGDETDKQGGRLLYVDSSRLPLPAQSGQRVSVTLYGNYIKDIQTLEDR